MKNILVLCDFSTPSINALKFAVEIATKSKAKLFLVNVIELPDIYFSEALPPEPIEVPARHGLSTISELEFQKQEKYYAGKQIEVTTRIIFGSVASQTIEFTKENNIDLVLMGSHGISGFKEPFFGSNVTKVVRRSSVPVLIVKEEIVRPVTSIVFPNDLAVHQDELVEKVKSLQAFFGAKLHVVWINTPFNFSTDVATKKRLDDFASKHQLQNFTLNIYNHINQDEGITLFTAFIKGDMIAMGTHGKTGLNHLIYGSVAEDEANHAESLIWTYSMNNAKRHENQPAKLSMQ